MKTAWELLCWPFKPTPFWKVFSIVAISVSLLIVIGCGLFYAKHLQNRSAILAVFKQEAAVVENATIWVAPSGKILHKPFSFRQYIDGIEKIDYSQCPMDFRLAWADYVQACEADQSLVSREAPIAFLEGATLNLSAATQTLQKRSDSSSRVEEARYNIRRVAIRYGFVFVKKS